MFEERVDQMTTDEVGRFEKLSRPSWLERMLGRKRIGEQADYTAKLVQVLEVSVEKCFVPKKTFDEENPLFILRIAEGKALVLFGQWLYDPNIMAVSDRTFEAWKGQESFFSSFTLRRAVKSGTALKLHVHGNAFTPAEHLDLNTFFSELRETQILSESDIVRK